MPSETHMFHGGPPKSRKTSPFPSPRRDVITWVLDSWERLPLEVVEKGMRKYVLTPATTDPSVPPAPSDLPPIPPQLDQALATLSTLALPDEPKEDDKGQEMEEEKEENGQDETSPGSSESDESVDDETLCVKCSNPLENRRVQCPFCKIWLHRRCMSVNSEGKCAFCL